MPRLPGRSARRSGKRPLTIENLFGGRGQSGARQASISPDGKLIAVSADGPEGQGVYVTTPDGSTAPKLWFQGGAVAAWFPDSQRVVVSRQNDLWTVRVGSTDSAPVTKDAENERAPAVSPDGKWIAFYSTRSGHQDIWIVPSDGSAAPRQLTQAANAEDDPRFSPAWSPDGRQIAYISNKADYWADDVWLVDVASGKARQLSKSLMAASSPAWSPDGKSIALLGNAKKGYWYEDLQDIYIVDAASGAERTVKMQVYATDWLHSLPVYWSGDGQSLYFVYHERGDLNLWSVPAKGGVATKLTNDRGTLRSFETTGQADAFVFVRSGAVLGSEAFYLPQIGGPPRQLTKFAEEWENVREPQEVAYRSFDGLYIQGFLYLPPAHAGRR